MRPASYLCVLFLVVPGVTVLVPKGPPELIEMPVTDLDYEEGETMKVGCLMKSRPRPIVYWYRNGKQMWHHHSPRYNISRTMLAVSHLHMNDSGVYICRGINQYGTKEVIFTLNVVPKNKGLKGDQQVSIVPSNRSATLGQSIKLECSLILEQDIQEYNVSWVKRDSLNQSVTNDTIIQTSVSYTDVSPVLYLLNLTDKDQGLYTCIISNEGVEHCHTWLWITTHSVHQSTESIAVKKDTIVIVYVVVPLVTLVGIMVAATLIYLWKRKSNGSSNQSVKYSTVEKKSDSTHNLVT